MACSVERSIVPFIYNIMITAGSSVGCPLDPEQGDKSARLIEKLRRLLNLVPCLCRHLEIVPLVATKVDPRLVPGEGEVVKHRIGPQCLLALTMEVTPNGPKVSRLFDNQERI